MSWLHPTDSLDDQARTSGLRFLLLDGVSTQVMGSLTGGALLVAFALLLGASNTIIGLIAAVGPLTQLLQIPAILLVERLRLRKAIVISTLLVARCFWVVVAAIPWVVPPDHRVGWLLASLALYFSFSSISSSAYNSWKRDLVPDETMGRFLATRLSIATAAGVNLCAGGITLKLAPRGKATAFLATNAITSGLAATVAPAIAGVAADRLAAEHVTLQLHWFSGDAPRLVLTALDLEGLDFVFLAAVLFGLYALHRLLAVREVGQIEEGLEVTELYREVRKAVRHVGNVAGLRRLTHFPFALLRPPADPDERPPES